MWMILITDLHHSYWFVIISGEYATENYWTTIKNKILKSNVKPTTVLFRNAEGFPHCFDCVTRGNWFYLRITCIPAAIVIFQIIFALVHDGEQQQWYNMSVDWVKWNLFTTGCCMMHTMQRDNFWEKSFGLLVLLSTLVLEFIPLCSVPKIWICA